MSLCGKCKITICTGRCDSVKGCSRFRKKAETNADRIRAMSDEELARQFGAQCPKENKRICDKRCHLCWLEWLRQLAEEDIK